MSHPGEVPHEPLNEGSIEMWLRSLAEDILDHSECEGCRANARTALVKLGEGPASPSGDPDGEPGLFFDL